MNQREIELRGLQTGVYTDMFGIDYPQYEQSKLYFVTNIGQRRPEILAWLKERNVEVIEEDSIFNYILVTMDIPEEVRQIGILLDSEFDCRLMWDYE